MESNLNPYGLRLIHYGFHGLVPHGLHGLVHMESMDWSHGLTQNRTENLLIILVSKCRVIDKIMYFVQRTGSCHVTCSHVNQCDRHQSSSSPPPPPPPPQSIPRRPLPAHHLYKSRHQTTDPGQLRDATMTPSHAPDSRRDNANKTQTKKDRKPEERDGTQKGQGRRKGRRKGRWKGRWKGKQQGVQGAPTFFYILYISTHLFYHTHTSPSPRTRKTRTVSRVFCVLWLHFPTLPPEHENCAHVGSIFLFGYFTTHYHPNTKNATMW